MTATFAPTLTDDHRYCDHLLALVEQAIDAGDWASAQSGAASFRAAVERHFQYEEEVFFPALEARAPMATGPTRVMRMEHTQIRYMLADLVTAISAQAADDCRGVIETLHLVTQQHNGKEEAILYPLADQVLLEDATGLLAEFTAHS